MEFSYLGFLLIFSYDGHILYDGAYIITFLLDDMLMMIHKGFADVMAEIRRLSTESHVSNPGSPVATTWTWYWKDENGIWQEYGVDHLVSLTRVLY